MTAVDDYIAQSPQQTHAALEQLRALIREIIPEATETISYGIPTFDLAGRHVVHIGGFAKHVGLYPTPSGMEEFADELSPYVRGKGSVRFELDEPLPTDLIRRVVAYRAAEVREEIDR
ncbi:MAG: iron chaperone [Coriobacteriia bacterium]